MEDADERFMREALVLADEAAALGEVPVGAVAVLDDAIVGRGSNRRETDRDPFAHAELSALAEAARRLGRWRLSGVSLFVTLEPCSLCVGAALQARIDRVVYGAPSPKAGALGGLFDLNALPHNHRLAVRAGVLEAACAERLTRFFQGLRAGEG
ncbi:MAG TPA: nucleoside deaminase [Myxococcaceae bacterium]|nr:nucleoside deaminase [Myxococcaceae bacterium]